MIEPSGPTNVQVVGTATLDFSGDGGALAGVFTTRFDSDGLVQARNIRRFGK